MQISSLQLRALARYLCSLVVPPQTLSGILESSIIANTGELLKTGASAVVSSSSNAGQSTTLSVLPGSWGPADAVSAMELLLEVVQDLEAAGTPEEDMCSELQKRLVRAPKEILKDFTQITR